MGNNENYLAFVIAGCVGLLLVLGFMLLQSSAQRKNLISHYERKQAELTAELGNEISTLETDLQSTKENLAEATKNFTDTVKEKEQLLLEVENLKAINRVATRHKDPEVQFQLGKEYEDGIVVHKNIRDAIKWYRLAAEKGHVESQIRLGNMYFSGKDVSKDKTEVMKWYSMAAEQGNAVAQYKLGWCYYEGTQTEKSIDEAKKWWVKSKEQGHTGAAKILSEVEREFAEAEQKEAKTSEDFTKESRSNDSVPSYTTSTWLGDSVSAARRYAKDVVRANLKAPSTAEFEWYPNAEKIAPNTWSVSGYVDAQNGFGAMLRNNYTVIVKHNGGGWEGWTAISCNIY